MPWPYDERHFEFAPGMYVPSRTLNEMQDKLVGLYQEKEIWARSFFSEGDWRPLGGSWIASGIGSLFIPFDLDTSAVIKDIWVKYFSGGPGNLKLELGRKKASLLVPDRPSSLEFFDEQRVQSNQPHWGVMHFADLTLKVDNDEQLLMRAFDANIDDKIFAVKLRVLPLDIESVY